MQDKIRQTYFGSQIMSKYNFRETFGEMVSDFKLEKQNQCENKYKSPA